MCDWIPKRHNREKMDIHRELVRYRKEGREPPSPEQTRQRETLSPRDMIGEKLDRRAEFLARRTEAKRDGPTRHRPRGPSLSRR